MFETGPTKSCLSSNQNLRILISWLIIILIKLGCKSPIPKTTGVNWSFLCFFEIIFHLLPFEVPILWLAFFCRRASTKPHWQWSPADCGPKQHTYIHSGELLDSNGKSPCSIGNPSSKDKISSTMLVYQSVIRTHPKNRPGSQVTARDWRSHSPGPRWKTNEWNYWLEVPGPCTCYRILKTTFSETTWHSAAWPLRFMNHDDPLLLPW